MSKTNKKVAIKNKVAIESKASGLTSNEVKPNPLSQFYLDTDELRLELVKTQYALQETRNSGQPTGLLVIVNGMELSGKGAAVTQLREWVDPRLLNVESILGYIPNALEPIWQSHVDKLPSHGSVTVYFGNWYADVLRGVFDIIIHNKRNTKAGADNKASKEDQSKLWTHFLSHKLAVLSSFEQDLMANGTKILKCWFHIDEATLKARLKDQKSDPIWLYHMDWRDNESVAMFNQVAKQLLSQQDDWIIIDGSNDNGIEATHSDKASRLFCHEVLHAMQQALIGSQQLANARPLSQAAYISRASDNDFLWVDIPDMLVDIDDPDMDKSEYKEALITKQQKLAKLLRNRYNTTANKHIDGYKDSEGYHVIFAFEGMDAAGKGGAIKRLVAPLDPREYTIHNIGAPMQYELRHPYLWRFWTKLPSFETRLEGEQFSRVVIFDRTWYGRVLVERIEGFASDAAWQRAYDEINRMEYDLAQQGTVILKYWMAIDKDEQLKRFEDRKDTPHKKFKLTDEDWRNRNKWESYVQAAADMLARTNTKHAPWHVVATNDKRTARIAVLDHAIAQLEQANHSTNENNKFIF